MRRSAFAALVLLILAVAVAVYFLTPYGRTPPAARLGLRAESGAHVAPALFLQLHHPYDP